MEKKESWFTFERCKIRTHVYALQIQRMNTRLNNSYNDSNSSTLVQTKDTSQMSLPSKVAIDLRIHTVGKGQNWIHTPWEGLTWLVSRILRFHEVASVKRSNCFDASMLEHWLHCGNCVCYPETVDRWMLNVRARVLLECVSSHLNEHLPRTGTLRIRASWN